VRRASSRNGGRPAARWRSRPARAAPPPGSTDLVQPGVDLGVDAGDEERGHRGDRGQVQAGLPGPLQAAQECIHHFVVAGQGEDQRDVDVDPFSQAHRDGWQALPGGRDLDEQVGPGELLVDAVVLHLAIYNGPDDCRDGIDSAEALTQGTIHRSTSPAGAAKVRRRPHITHP
jgi:hypothetical protein